MNRIIELLYDTIGTKRQQLSTANKNREEYIKHLCSQQRAISSLVEDIERLEADLKNLHSMSVPAKMMGADNGCNLSPGATLAKKESSLDKEVRNS